MSPYLLTGLCAALSVTTFLVYALDKRAARRRHWRVPEKLLHLLALLGGWPGALAAQQVLRHKTRKLQFQALFWTTVMLNLSFLWYLLHR